MNVQYAVLAARLKEERERLGLTQDQMAEAGGIKKRTYCNYEAGDRVPDAEALEAWASAGADVTYLLTGRRVSATALGLAVLSLGHGFVARLRQLVGTTPGEVQAFAARCLLSPEQLQAYLDGQQFPRVDTLIALAALTGASLDWLLLDAPAEGQLDPRETALIHRLRAAPEAARQAVSTLVEWGAEPLPAPQDEAGQKDEKDG